VRHGPGRGDRIRARGDLAFVATSVLLAAGSLLGAGCGANEPTYVPGGALEVDGQGTEAIQTLPLVFRVPTSAEEAERQKLSAQLGYEVPWLREDRVHVEIRFTVTNLPDSAREGSFSLNIDGASEFVRYDEDAVAAYQSTVREDDFHEMSLDLDALGRWMAPNFPAVLLYRSETDPTDLKGEYQMAPPKLIRPALWEITLRFNATQPMRCEFLVRVRDDDQRLWEDGENQFMPSPATYAPMIAPRM
jgi:hypothetical protein